MVKIIESEKGRIGHITKEGKLFRPPADTHQNLRDYLTQNNLQHLITEPIDVPATISGDHDSRFENMRERLEQLATEYGASNVIVSKEYSRVRSRGGGEDDHYLATFYGQGPTRSR